MPPTNPPAGRPHPDIIQAASYHADEIGQHLRALDEALSAADEFEETGTGLEPAVVELDRLIAAARAAKAALSARPRLTVAA
ncbi:hypothetical protein Q8791_23035 [Nocardiopsis sp. CT-R113]|uniref:Uncharacterized protein n=1 Tax=Nocardiopsis codii TaxID=3065942 RepID=A0ABU7KCY9_9ACTN|nr:hypothetical protein [Nocardiopsis sp. CT-R113]MEE2040096.1 hypothetical protein [Nocardiopsis sp. CT-R113]